MAPSTMSIPIAPGPASISFVRGHRRVPEERVGADMSDSAARGRGSRSRRFILAGIVIVAILAVGYIGLVLLGSRVDTAVRGSR